MTCLAEKIIGDSPEFGFTIDRSVTRIREHSLALDRCKRFSEIPKISFEMNLKPLEWAVFAYYYSLAPRDHPSELSASTHLKIGRNTLAATLDVLASKGMVFFDMHARTKLRIVNVSHPQYWNRDPSGNELGHWTNPATHVPKLCGSLPERVNDAKDFAHAPGQHVRLPYLLFHTLIHPTSKFLYGMLCYLGVNTHPTTRQLAAALRCSAPTAALRIAELEEYRMIYSDARDPENFGEHTRYFYHLTDVAFWKSQKAEHWYPGGENSLIARLDAAGFAGQRNIRRPDETEDFRPYADDSQVFARPLPHHDMAQARQVISQIRQKSSEARQVTSQIRQITPQIRQDVESSRSVLVTSSEQSQETSQVRQVISQIRHDGLRQIKPQIRQIRLQRRQNRSQIRQIKLQRRQIKSQGIEKPGSSPVPERVSEDSSFAKNTIIRNTNNKNTVRKELRARERWAPVDVTFHPRLINIAQAAAIVWRDRDYKWDRALWNGTVEEIALERGEKEAVRFVSYVKDANAAWGREFPYSPQLMQNFLDAFRAGKHWASILGPQYEERAKAEIPAEDGNSDSSSGSQNQAVVVPEPSDRHKANLESVEPLQIDPGTPQSGSGFRDSRDPERITEHTAPVAAKEVDLHPAASVAGAEEAAPDPQPPAPVDISSAETKQPPGTEIKKAKPVQLTHANLLDFPARGVAREKPADPPTRITDVVSASAEPSDRRIQLEKAIGILTLGMKSRDSLKRGFAKLDDDALFDNLCFLFGPERIRAMVSGRS